VEDAEAVIKALEDNNEEAAKPLARKYLLNLQHSFKLNSALVILYESKLKKLEDHEERESTMTKTQKEQITIEMKEMEQICNFGVTEGGDVDVLKSDVFWNLLNNFEEKCPLLNSVLQTLLVTDSRQRVHKTPEYKLTCGVNALALLLSVRNQKCKNDVRLLLGLVSITYGAGKQFINLLNAMGLTPHWDTLYVYYYYSNYSYYYTVCAHQSILSLSKKCL
jgi:hypothetical protein